MRRGWFRLAICLVLAFSAGRASAASPEAEQQARRSFEQAEDHFKAGLYAEALGEYQKGYEQLPLPGFLVNIAQCQRRLGDLKQAQATYRKFIMVAPDSPYVPEVRELVAELDKLIESTEAAQPAGPTKAQEAEAGPGSLVPPPVPPPAPEPVASALVEPPPPPPPAPPPPAAKGTRWWLWGSAGAAVLLGAATTAYLLRSPENTTVHDGSLGTLRR
jgi:tetratricopeptide (TPR) repeat protein